MDRGLLKDVVQEQYQVLQTLPSGIERECLSEIMAVLGLPHIVAITGMRRSGKSTLMLQALRQTFPEQIYYLDFEDERLINFNVDDFNVLYEIFIELYGERKVFFFDEIQVVDQWETYIRRMYKAGNKFVISGSSADLLSSELSTKLTGRHITIELLPFSFREYLRFTENSTSEVAPILTKERGLLKNAFNEFSVSGGIPEYLQYKNPIIIKNIYENILYKDVIVRFDIKAVKAIRELSLWLLSTPGALISYSKLKNILHLGSINTVKNYIHYLESAYLIFTLDKYAFSTSVQTSAQKKVYCIDTGFLEIIGFQFSKNAGKYLENIVYLDLRRYSIPLQYSIYYYKTKNDLEVDFCLRVGKKIIMLIQICDNISHIKTREREIRALMTAMNELNLNEGFIITLDQTETIKIDQKVIQCISVVDWLRKFPLLEKK
ncbi:MAG: ATP-binding protein [Gammaproteobacteria bacterium]